MILDHDSQTWRVEFAESRYTAPSAECPHPERWHSPDDDSTETEVSEFVGAFVRVLQPDTVVETGTAWGYTALEIGKALQRNGHGHLYTMEPNGERAATAREMCRGLPVTVLTQKSEEFVPPPPPIDLAWLDSHMPIRGDEYRMLRPHLRPGAIVGFHDAGAQHGHRDEWEAVDPEHLRFIYLPTPRGVMFGEYRQ